MSIIDKLVSWFCSFFNIHHPPVREEKITLTGEDSEWVDVGHYVNEHPGRLFQNKYCTSVFKHRSGYAYDVNRYQLVKGDIEYITDHSSCAVEFPYTPRTTIIYIDSWEYLVFRLYHFFNVEYKHE